MMSCVCRSVSWPSTLASLDPDAGLLHRDDEEDAVVLPLLAELPVIERPVSDVLDRLPVERRQDQDRDLGTGRAVDALEPLLQIRLLARGQLARPVGDVAVDRRGSVGRGPGGRRCGERQEREEGGGPPEPSRERPATHRPPGSHPKLTFGAPTYCPPESLPAAPASSQRLPPSGATV